LFAQVHEPRSRGHDPGRFSFNVKGSCREACQGDGVIKVEIHFLPDLYVRFDTCDGKRYNRETPDIRYLGKDISDVLKLSTGDALAATLSRERISQASRFEKKRSCSR